MGYLKTVSKTTFFETKKVMISRESIEELFQHTRQLHKEVKASYDIDDICRWSYFFLDEDIDKLTQLGTFLEDDGYEIIGFIEPEWEDENKNDVVLRADRVEKNTAETLFETSKKLSEVARRFNISSYDGMDVGSVDEL